MKTPMEWYKKMIETQSEEFQNEGKDPDVVDVEIISEIQSEAFAEGYEKAKAEAIAALGECNHVGACGYDAESYCTYPAKEFISALTPKEKI